MGEGESGKLLKKMMRDRRVDSGNKWSPIFGRYGFPTQGGEIRVGDEVLVTKRNKDHTVWSELSCLLAILHHGSLTLGLDGVMPRLAKFEEVAV